ncbi:MAG TPA: lipopolysaccharide biosynthesis protein [Gemmatimonadales bacterium]|nr:lipopolysaccharide biosynthesis protein [Gemmatimonadales bacterium]
MDRSLLRAAIVASGWAFLARTLVGFAGFLRTLVLARLLLPQDFGAMGTALVVLGAVEALTATGFDTALMQRAGDIDAFYDSAFTVQLLRGIALAIFVWLAAPMASTFVNAPILTSVLRAIAVILLLRGLANPAKLRFYRELRYETLFWWSVPEIAVGLGLSIALGFALRNVWALVIPAIAAQAVAVIVSYVLARRRPRLALERSRLRELVRYSKWVFGTHVMTFLSLQGDNGFVAKMLGIGSLGFYQVAFRVAELPVTGVTQVLNQVALPTLSGLQVERPRLRSWYAGAQSLILIIHGAFVVLILLAGRPLVHILLGATWMPIVPVLKILVVAMWIRSIVDFSGTLFNAVGEPRLTYRLHVIRVVIMVIAIYPLSQLMNGISGVAASIVLSQFGAALLCLKYLRSTLGPRLWQDARQLVWKRS